MIQSCRILLVFTVLFVFGFNTNAQQKPPSKVDDVFFDYVSKTLELKPSDAAQIRPLVKKYLDERKKVYGRFSDPLEREQEILNIKINARKEMAAIIGLQKANAFFSSEQNFRRKVREELKERDKERKKN